jgi:uncharacterized protein
MIEINKDISLIDTAVYIKSIETLSISDMHLGYEEMLHKKGILTPKFQFKDAKKRIIKIFGEVKVKRLILNGDLKHTFGRIQDSEWSEILRFIEFAFEYVKEIIIITGNHDVTLNPILKKKNMKTMKCFEDNNYLFAHGDEMIETDKTIIIGHNHPAITISDGIRHEKYKCFIRSDKIIMQPSFHYITIGSDILKNELTSPYLKNTDSSKWHIYIVNDDGEVMDFGKNSTSQ